METQAAPNSSDFHVMDVEKQVVVVKDVEDSSPGDVNASAHKDWIIFGIGFLCPFTWIYGVLKPLFVKRQSGSFFKSRGHLYAWICNIVALTLLVAALIVVGVVVGTHHNATKDSVKLFGSPISSGATIPPSASNSKTPSTSPSITISPSPSTTQSPSSSSGHPECRIGGRWVTECQLVYQCCDSKNRLKSRQECKQKYKCY